MIHESRKALSETKSRDLARDIVRMSGCDVFSIENISQPQGMTGVRLVLR